MGVGLAASLLLAVAIGTDTLSFGPKVEAPQIAAKSAPAATPKAHASGEFVTMKGERRTVRLDDGTAITLNTASAVRDGYAADHRHVRMRRGQALFEAAKAQQRPLG